MNGADHRGALPPGRFIPGFDPGIPVDRQITVDLPASGTWQRMAVLYEAVAREVCSRELPVMVVSGDCTTSLAVIAGLQRAGRDVGIVWIDAHGDFNTEATTPSGYLGGMPPRTRSESEPSRCRAS